ncbi:hypothetical protein J2Z31_001820 [Sinorhizobium kostiense]|uniref:Transmembrane protein n=1 Tax=Sinorhizobium kostiense TaxID=76747 RepID=A0ABS4QXF5_9HYPH|nr:hypothetical protein [Sinorhizobium kostiense]MBP2235328.1 hypothetical protein [Sinorhizobium kostiense]
MSRNSYAKGSLMNLLVHSAVAGVGLSIGRDAYRKTRDNIVVIVLAAVALAGTAYGFWNMARGHARGVLGTIFLTFLMNAVIIAASFALFMFALLVVAGSGSDGEDNAQGVLFVGIGIQLVLAAAGLLYGLFQRPKRKKAFQVDAHNEDFLVRNGFRDVGGREQVIVDPDGNELVLEDFRNDAVVFKVKGRRSVRAKILLDGDGRMLNYVPA